MPTWLLLANPDFQTFRKPNYVHCASYYSLFLPSSLGHCKTKWFVGFFYWNLSPFQMWTKKLISRTFLSTISNIERGLIRQVYQGCHRHQPKTSRDFLGTNYRQLETFIMTPSIFMVMKKEMNFPVAFKLKAFIYHYFYILETLISFKVQTL